MVFPQITELPQTTLLPWMLALPQTTEFPQMTEVPFTTVFPQMTELPQITVFPQMTELPQMTEEPPGWPRVGFEVISIVLLTLRAKGEAALALGKLRATQAEKRLREMVEDDWDANARGRAKEALERIAG